ncbi:hypothetical protein Acr_06g0009310 [Actinidia rufa]|uniref:Uncharacterized protein n=1 Tax=Actinidia rufa TaxID=165716 RepID=A0A7J0ER75_9ERIC|nr:hypothetical protein Acr_06g0009310 [Actinidia rufa]
MLCAERLGREGLLWCFESTESREGCVLVRLESKTERYREMRESAEREGLQWRNKRASSREPQEEVKKKKRPEKRSQEGGHRGQEKRSKKRYQQMMAEDRIQRSHFNAFIATRRDKKNCPRNKAQDQSSEAATTAMMAVDERIAYHLCGDREVFSTHVACEGLIRMANDAIVGKGQSGFRMADGRSMKVTGVRHVSLRCRSRSDEALKLVEEHSEFPRETGEAVGRRKTERLYRLRENVQTGELCRHRSSGISKMNGRRKAIVAQRHAKQAQEYLMDVLEGSTGNRSAKRYFGYVRKSGQTREETVSDSCAEKMGKEERDALTEAVRDAERREAPSSIVKNGAV